MSARLFPLPPPQPPTPHPQSPSLAQSLKFESAALLSSSFLDARFEMEHAVKTESRRVSVC